MRLGNLNIKRGIVSYDTETTGLISAGNFKRWGFYPARPFVYSFYDDEGNSAYVRWEVDPFTRRVIPLKRDVKAIGQILEDPKIVKVGHNISYDNRMSRTIDLSVKGSLHDTMYMAHVVTGGGLLSYGLKELGVLIAGYSDDDEKDLIEDVKKKRREAKKKGWCIATEEFHGNKPYKADYWLANRGLCKKYALCDAERTMIFYLAWYEKIMNDSNLKEVYQREMRLLPVVSRMENIGTRVFPDDLDRLRKWYENYRNKWTRVANKNGGKNLNPKSPKQMIKKFIIEKKYKPMYWGDEVKKSSFFPEIDPKRNPKINGDFLKHLVEKHDDKLAKAVLERNGASHMITGFLNVYDRFRTEEEKNVWILHPNYRQCGPITGRFSCGDPNLMQVASPTTGRRRTDVTLRPREAFGPREGYLWYLPDYSQIEVWVFSFLAEEKAMMKALMAGRDFHGAVAETVWGNHPEFKKDPAYYRKRAKLLMFCKLYGGGVGKVAYLTDSTRSQAAEFVADFDRELPGISKFSEEMIEKIESGHKLINPMGRTYAIKKKLAYRAVNYLVQGTAADILKEAMIRIDHLFQTRWKGCRMLLTLHDELALEIPKEYHSKQLMREIIVEMQGDSAKVGIPVPLPVGIKIAKRRWSEIVEIKSLTKEWKDKYLCKK